MPAPVTPPPAFDAREFDFERFVIRCMVRGRELQGSLPDHRNGKLIEASKPLAAELAARYAVFPVEVVEAAKKHTDIFCAGSVSCLACIMARAILAAIPTAKELTHG